MSRSLAAVVISLVLAVSPLAAIAQAPLLGAVVMHGKGGTPTRHVAELAAGLEANGFVVANLDMPWSGGRNYDVDTDQAAKQVEAAIADLKAKGATRIFIMGHSQGGVFGLHLASRLPVDGIVAIAPGGTVDNQVYKDATGESLARAKRLVAEGKGTEKQRFDDYEASRKTYTVISPPAAYATWFDPAGAMSMARTLREIPVTVPVLWVSPVNDYPGLRKLAPVLFERLPKNPQNRLSQPNADHLGAPRAALPDILAWTAVIASTSR